MLVARSSQPPVPDREGLLRSSQAFEPGEFRDDKGRIVVAICHNSDVGGAWEWTDSPQYPERAASLTYRIGINYVIYGMTH
jgi:uncharacterized protein DUF4159